MYTITKKTSGLPSLWSKILKQSIWSLMTSGKGNKNEIGNLVIITINKSEPERTRGVN